MYLHRKSPWYTQNGASSTRIHKISTVKLLDSWFHHVGQVNTVGQQCDITGVTYSKSAERQRDRRGTEREKERNRVRKRERRKKRGLENLVYM